MPVLIFNQRSVQEILDVIIAVGQLVGRGERARNLVSGYITHLERIQAHAAQRERIRVYFEEWDDPMITGIQWVSELIDIAGGEDIFQDRSTGKLAKERFVSVEEVIQGAPEVVLASWCGKAFDRTAFESRPGFKDLPAIQTGRVHEIAAEVILQPGPACLTDGLAAIETALRA